MEKIKCFDVVKMVIDEATSQFGVLWKVNPEELRKLNERCEFIDKLSDESNGVSYDVSVDDKTMDISVTLECDELIAENKDHVIYRLMNGSKSINLFAHDGHLCIKFKFGSIWDRAI